MNTIYILYIVLYWYYLLYGILYNDNRNIREEKVMNIL